MPAKKQSAVTWAACKRAISKWPRPGVVALVKELYDLSDDNRRFLHGRLLNEQADRNREAARRAIDKLVNSTTVFHDRFRHADVKRVIDQYAKATGDDAGVAELLVHDLGASLKPFHEFGGGDERMVDHLYASMERLHKTLERLAPDEARPVVEKLAALGEQYDGEFGYGVSDELKGLADEWQDRLASRDTP